VKVEVEVKDKKTKIKDSPKLEKSADTTKKVEPKAKI
jgi:hypothetical protein